MSEDQDTTPAETENDEEIREFVEDVESDPSQNPELDETGTDRLRGG